MREKSVRNEDDAHGSDSGANETAEHKEPLAEHVRHELTNLARAVADRQHIEAYYNRVAAAQIEGRLGRPLPSSSPTRAPGLEGLIQVGRAYNFLRRLEDPRASADDEALMGWLSDQDIEELAELVDQDDPRRRTLLRSPSLRDNITNLTQAMILSRIRDDLQPDSPAHRELARYERLIPACREVAEARGFDTSQVLRNDALWAEAFRTAYPPDEFLQEQFDRADPQNSTIFDEIFEEVIGENARSHGTPPTRMRAMAALFRRQFNQGLAAEGPNPTKRSLAHHQRTIHAQAKDRFERIYGEEAAADLPPELRIWLYEDEGPAI